MEKIRNVATLCIGRAVLFGALAIGLVMLSLSFDLEKALQAGAILMLVMAQILILKAHGTWRRNPKRTEAWACLDPALRPSGKQGLDVFRSILVEVYLGFASRTLALGCSLFVAFATLRLLRAAG